MTSTTKPHRKVVAATIGSGVGSAVTIILLWILTEAKVTTPPEVAVAISLIVSAACAFAAGYITPAAPTDLPTPVGANA
jgi:hypothetical protein